MLGFRRPRRFIWGACRPVKQAAEKIVVPPKAALCARRVYCPGLAVLVLLGALFALASSARRSAVHAAALCAPRSSQSQRLAPLLAAAPACTKATVCKSSTQRNAHTCTSCIDPACIQCHSRPVQRNTPTGLFHQRQPACSTSAKASASSPHQAAVATWPHNKTSKRRWIAAASTSKTACALPRPRRHCAAGGRCISGRPELERVVRGGGPKPA